MSMSLSRINASAATLTKNRTDGSITPISGMCVTCVDGCIGMCEIGKSAYRGHEVIYPQPFGVIPTHSSGGSPEFRDLTGVFNRLKEILNRGKGVDMIKIRIYENKVTVSLSNLFNLAVIVGVQFGSQKIIARVARHVNDGICRQRWILSP